MGKTEEKYYKRENLRIRKVSRITGLDSYSEQEHKYYQLITEIKKQYPKDHNPFKHDEKLFLRLCREADFPVIETVKHDWSVNLGSYSKRKDESVIVKSIPLAPHRKIERITKDESKRIKEIILSLGTNRAEFTTKEMKLAIKKEFPIIDVDYILSSQIAYLINLSAIEVARKEKGRKPENKKATVVNFYRVCGKID